MAVLLAATGCRDQSGNGYQGYIEGEFVYVSVPLGGSLEELAVARGNQVSAGQHLFVLEHEAETAAVREAEFLLDEAVSHLEDLRKGKRPTEIAALEAQLEEAQARLVLAQHQLDRRRKVTEATPGAVSEEEVERFTIEVAAARARAARLEADLETARLGARSDEVAAAEKEVSARRAALDKTQWALQQKSAVSPVDGQVQDTLYRPGEWVAPGSPVVVVLPPENIKVRFFVPEPEFGAIVPGDRVAVRFDGAQHDFEGRVSFVSTQAEFTPPVIYSEEHRAKLVYLVEASFAPDDARQLKPGLPVDVRRLPPQP